MTSSPMAIPGYEDLLHTLEEHVSLVLPRVGRPIPVNYQQTNNTNKSKNGLRLSSGILLTGSAGVGKSFLVSSLAHRLTATTTTRTTPATSRDSSYYDGSDRDLLGKQQHAQDPQETTMWQIQWVSLHNLSMRVAESPLASIEEIASWILPPSASIPSSSATEQRSPPTKTEKLTCSASSKEYWASFSSFLLLHRRTLLVLDDLDLVMNTTGTTTSYGNDDGSATVASFTTAHNVELKRIEASLIYLLDSIVDPAAVQVIGIARLLASESLSSPFTKVNRLDCHFHMEPPTQWQRQEILERLLISLFDEEEKQDRKVDANNDSSSRGTMEPSSTQREERRFGATMITPTRDEKKQNKRTRAREWANRLSTVTPGFVAGDLAQLCLNAHLRAQATAATRVASTGDLSKKDAVDKDEAHAAVENKDAESIEEWLARQSHWEEGQHHATMVPVSWNDLAYVAQSMVPSQLEYLDVVRPPLMVMDTLQHAQQQHDQQQHKDTSLGQEEQAPLLAELALRDSRLPTMARLYRHWYTQHEECWKPLVGYALLKKHVFRSIVLPWRQFLTGVNQKENGGTLQPENATATSHSNPSKAAPPPRGVLFHGPSGCGKTLAATCLAASCGLPMIRVRPADILDKWLGGSEAALRSIFQRARSAAPCILFLDELDALATNRQQDTDDGGDTTGVMARLLSTFLNELDGVTTLSSSSNHQAVLVVACTNRMESLDAALLRPGRLEEHIKVPPPAHEDVHAILQHYFVWPTSAIIGFGFGSSSSSENVLIKEDKANGEKIDQQENCMVETPTKSPWFVDDDVDLKQLATRLVESNDREYITAATLEGLSREAVLRCIRKQTSSSKNTDRVSYQEKKANDEFLPKLVSWADINDAIQALHLLC
ncbi:hypothetical protein ACA910_010046 [Epithemia clementina (nom. ined.)]